MEKSIPNNSYGWNFSLIENLAKNKSGPFRRLNIKNWTREEQEMIHTWNRNAANYFETMQIKYDEGKEKGIRNEKIKTLKRMLKARIPAETIVN
ncbi:hypothetical protein [Streptococcus suis]|uniref:hypothetical protein n=2 Tax=Streptococcus suis TaxID=1307 RepID=UPI000462D0EC|nr:hypothetical protein [Streptococcus suis]